eukprot:10895931-Karenia_brevis.AAC.1
MLWGAVTELVHTESMRQRIRELEDGSICSLRPRTNSAYTILVQTACAHKPPLRLGIRTYWNVDGGPCYHDYIMLDTAEE